MVRLIPIWLASSLERVLASYGTDTVMVVGPGSNPAQDMFVRLGGCLIKKFTELRSSLFIASARNEHMMKIVPQRIAHNNYLDSKGRYESANTQVYPGTSVADPGSGIRCLFDPWIRNPEYVLYGSWIPDLGS